jgi:hypothetical protein
MDDQVGRQAQRGMVVTGVYEIGDVRKWIDDRDMEKYGYVYLREGVIPLFRL